MSAEQPGSIEFAGVWKKFHYGEVHNRLRDAIPALVSRTFRKREPVEALQRGQFWALQDVSFKVGQGESLGIIGPNGAGKSTVLKLLTRIMRPTRGRCIVRGRIGALIEVAAGFHPDLTGRENVFLQGIIMGMPRRVIARRFDEIVAFSGVERFIDTPVKRYSSGMQTRLGFSIAAHLEPDVMIIDEALAVGDAAFQTKAFARVHELVKRDIPAVLVSHDMEAIATLCTHAVLLQKGRVACDGTPAECIAAYMSGATAGTQQDTDPIIRITAMHLGSAFVSSGQRVAIELHCEVEDGDRTSDASVRIRVRAAGSGEVCFDVGGPQLVDTLPRAFGLAFDVQMNLQRGSYLIESLVWDGAGNRVSFVGPVHSFEVRDGLAFNGMVQPNATSRVCRVSSLSA